MENTLFTNKRLLNLRELVTYTGLGESKARAWAREIGAARKIGRRTVYDRAIIDKSIDGLARQEA
ncbi:polyprenyl synthetase solanesyl diphosphate synthase [uncultured Dialister sp.]|uniref:polyprenyl synthetase solanesyl diphosphate synthase n=1 Tax=uncultured Dialister sp. TaxID=278064 RepID=UPI0025997975|nr:polyprenyl synthetase solanesyl diphosphate synthase [uncultured Dialister sp.]